MNTGKWEQTTRRKGKEKNKIKKGILVMDSELSHSRFLITLTSGSKKIDGQMENFTGEPNHMKNEPNSPRVI